MKVSRTIQVVQASCLVLLCLASIASAQGLANSGVYVPWAAVTAAVAVIGVIGTGIGLIRRGDLGRIQERCEEHKQQRAELIEWLRRVEAKIDDVIKER